MNDCRGSGKRRSERPTPRGDGGRATGGALRDHGQVRIEAACGRTDARARVATRSARATRLPSTLSVTNTSTPLTPLHLSCLLLRFTQWMEREQVGEKFDAFVAEHAAQISEIAQGMGGEQSHDWWPLYQKYTAQFESYLEGAPSLAPPNTLSALHQVHSHRCAVGAHLKPTQHVPLQSLSHHTTRRRRSSWMPRRKRRA